MLESFGADVREFLLINAVYLLLFLFLGVCFWLVRFLYERGRTPGVLAGGVAVYALLLAGRVERAFELMGAYALFFAWVLVARQTYGPSRRDRKPPPAGR